MADKATSQGAFQEDRGRARCHSPLAMAKALAIGTAVVDLLNIAWKDQQAGDVSYEVL